MRAVIADNQWLYLDNITDAEERIIWAEFSVSDDNRYIDPNQNASYWDGVHRKYNRAKRRMARPYLIYLRSVCKKHNLPLEIEDHRDPWPYAINGDITPDFLPGITLDENQARAIRRACQTEVGIIEAPTGGGKTEIISGICKAIDCPTAIITEQKVVIDQIKARLELRDVKNDIGLFYAGRRPTNQVIIVGSIQSLQNPKVLPDFEPRTKDETDEAYNKRLAKWDGRLKAFKTRRKNARYLQELVSRAEMLIVDECDLATNTNYKNLFRFWFKGRRRYGFSATPFDPEKPVEAMVLQEHLGSVIARETRQTLVAMNRIIECEYNMLAIGPFDGITERSAYDIAINEHVVENKSVHSLVSGICRRYPDDGTLILVDREALGEALLEELAKHGIEAHFIYGKTSKRLRDAKLRAFENREYKVLIGGKIINRGLDLKGGCENLILMSGGKQQSKLLQSVGRALRKNSLGRSRVFDLFFRCNKYLYEHSKAKLKIMVANGYKTTIILPGGTIDGADLIRRRFRIPDKLFRRPEAKLPGCSGT